MGLSQNERNMPTTRYTPGLGRDHVSPGITCRDMFPDLCQVKAEGCTVTSVISKRVNDTHIYKAMCPSCAGL